MKTEELKAKGLTQEQIDYIMAENGKDVEAEKGKLTALTAERDNLKTQLDTAKASLKEFEGVDVKELQGKITELSNNLTAKDAEYQQKIDDMQFDALIDNSLTGSGARNTKAVKALLNIDSLKASKNREADIKAAIEAVQKDNDYLFQAAEGDPQFVGGTGGSGGADPMSAIRAAMGLKPTEK